MTWTCLRVKTHYDAYVAHRLRDVMAMTVKFLTFKGTEKRGKREVPILKPLFPGYLFVGLNPEHEPWTHIGYQFGVLGFLMQGDKPAILPPRSEALVFAHSDPRGIVDLERRLISPYQQSVLVRVNGGVFDGHEGPILTRDTKKNIRVLLSVLGGQEVEFPESRLEIVG